jgi:hypothetical protein
MKRQNETGKVDSVETLQLAQQRLKMRIKEQERELRKRVQQVPGELFYSGVNSVVPTIISGKITSSVIKAGKNLVDKAFVKKGAEGNNSKLITAAKQAGIFTLLKIAYKAFVRNK